MRVYVNVVGCLIIIIIVIIIIIITIIIIIIIIFIIIIIIIILNIIFHVFCFPDHAIKSLHEKAKQARKRKEQSIQRIQKKTFLPSIRLL